MSVSDYIPSQRKLNFNGLKMYNNTAGKAGQSMYLIMTKVAEWCRLGIAGEYVKGNYSDGISNQNELQGIPITYTAFTQLSSTQINQQQKYLEDYWNIPKGSIWHVSNRNIALIKGNDQSGCAEYNNPCKTIDYVLSQISQLKEGSITAYTSEKRIGISQYGYDLQSPMQFSRISSHTNILKIMKQLYGTDQVMNGQAEMKILKNNDNNNENGKLGWIQTAEGIELRLYYINIIMDDSQLSIPIIYIQDSNSILELNSITFTGITLSPSIEPKGIIQINYDNSQFIAQSCIFENINIEEQGGNAIRILNSGSYPISATIKGCQFNNISCIGDSNGRGGSAIYMENKHGSKLLIDDQCQFYQCIVDKRNGGAIYIDIDFDSEFEFKINDATIQNCQAITNTSSTFPTGYGGGIFLTGSGNYDPQRLKLDLIGMKIYQNTAEIAGQSLYVVMNKLQEWCRTGTQGQYVKGNYSDTLSNSNEIEGIAKDQSSFNTLYPQEIQAQQNHLQYFWTSQIASLISVGVILNVSNTDAPLQFSIKGRGMIQDKLCVKLIEIGSKTSVNLILAIKQVNAIEVIYPPENSTDQIHIEGNPQSEQTASFGMKDYSWYDNKKKYNILLSNDRKIFTGVEGKEDSGISLNVQELVEEEKYDEIEGADSPKGSSFPIWAIILIVVVGILLVGTASIIIFYFICKYKNQKDQKEDKVQMENINSTQKQEPYVPQQQSSYNPPLSSNYINQSQSQTQNQDNYSSGMNQPNTVTQTLSHASPDIGNVSQTLGI